MDMTTYVQPVQYPDEVVEINVWTNGDLLRDAIAERINVLFWQKRDTEIWTTNIRIMHVIQEAQEDIQDIQRVLPEVESNEIPVFLAYPEELRQSRRIAAFRDFVTEEIIAQRRRIKAAALQHDA